MKPLLALSLSAFLMFSASLAASPAFALDESNIIVRVCVIDEADSVKLSLKGPYYIYPLHSDEAIKGGDGLATRVRATKGGILLGREELKTGGITIKVAEDAGILVNSLRLRGYIDIIRTGSLKLIVVNHLEIDRYLCGVLYNEVSHFWPLEVLKAQAIAARTFALYQRRQNKARDYDLRSDIYSQVYRGSDSEKWTTNKAVFLTSRLVLTYNGDIFPAYYHANCAGMTEAASNLWNINTPPLRGVECPYCKYTRHYKWSDRIPLEDIRTKLVAAGYKIGEIESIVVLSRNKSNRAEKLEVKDTAGTVVIITAKDFRQILQSNTIRSTNFEVDIKGGTAVFDGFGWGHGVGMCQWGAYGMSKLKKSAAEILQFYYPGAKVTKVSDEIVRI